MLFDSARHEPLNALDWDEGAAARMIERIVRDTEQRFSIGHGWPMAPADADGGERKPVFNLYLGAAGVVWALHYLAVVGAAKLRRDYDDYVERLPALNRAWLDTQGAAEWDAASYLMGDTGVVLVGHWLRPTAHKAARLADLIAANVDHPARELMWGAPGTLLASLFLHRRTGETRWADLYRTSARKLWSELVWSPEYRCHYWVQQLYGDESVYLGAVHGFVATAAAIIQGRHLMEAGEWNAWQQCIVDTVRHTAVREDHHANWPPYLELSKRAPTHRKMLMQFCHGAPGFVVCLANLPSAELDDDLLAAGEVIWSAGPLVKGSNLCHGTGGNGYAFLKLYQRTGDTRWLSRARAFAMHGIAQTEAHAREFGQMRYSLWTGDLGFAIYLRDCMRGTGAFPTLDTFFIAAD